MSNDDEKTAPGGLPVQPGPSQEMQMVASYNAMRSAYLQQVAKYEELIGRVAQLYMLALARRADEHVIADGGSGGGR